MPMNNTGTPSTRLLAGYGLRGADGDTALKRAPYRGGETPRAPGLTMGTGRGVRYACPICLQQVDIDTDGFGGLVDREPVTGARHVCH